MLRLAWRVFKWLFLAGVLLGIVAAFVGLGLAMHVVEGLGKDLPAVGEGTYRPALATKVVDRNGVLLTTLHEEEIRNRIVPVSEIPRLTKLSFVAVEDERFYQHYGIDPRGILRAAWKNFRAGGVVEGGSTITQQLAKNRFLKPERTVKRKLQEMILATRLERSYSKDEILGQYLNEIFFGKGMYGISSAAQFYFGKKTADLSLAESAVLASLPKAPNRFTPAAHSKACQDRQKLVLTKMWEQGYVTREEALAAMAEPLKFTNEREKQEHVSEKAQYFMAFVKKKLIEMYGVRQVYTGGLKVTTTLDWTAQELAEKRFAGAEIFKGKPVGQFANLQGGLVALDPATGDIRAMVGGREFETNQYNRAVQARRQPGSSFKPFVYAAALLQGIQPNAIINDEPIRYENPEKRQKDRFWEPKNFGDVFHGPTILAKALAGSYNVVAVKLLERVGVSNVIAVARRMGITTPLEPSLPLALGSSEVTLLEMVSAYSSFANQGILAAPRAILKIEDFEGKTLYQAESNEKEVMDENTAFLMTHLLRGVVERGSGTAARVPGRVVAGKTGTSNRFVDGWFVGFCPELAVGCFIGNDDRKSLGEGKAGGQVAAPIVGAFLKDYLKDRPAREFKKPSNVEIVTVCTDSGLIPCQGCTDRWTLAFAKDRAPSAPCNLHQPLDIAGLPEDESTEESAETTEAIGQALPDEEALGGKGEIGAGPGTATAAQAAGAEEELAEEEPEDEGSEPLPEEADTPAVDDASAEDPQDLAPGPTDRIYLPETAASKPQPLSPEDEALFKRKY